MPLGYPQNVKAKSLSVNGTTTLSGAVHITSTTNGFVVPRMDTDASANVVNLVNGTIIYDTDTDLFMGYANGVWVAIGDQAA
jgi:hypothetical protein